MAEKKVKKTQKKRKKKKSPSVTLVRLCKNLQECDIDEVAKIISEMGKKKELILLKREIIPPI